MDGMRQTGRSLLGWLGGHELGILVLLFAVAAGVWAFATLASDVKEGETDAFDRRILLSMRHPGDLSPIGSPAVEEAVRDVSALGGAALLGLITVIAAGFLVLDGKRHMAYFAAGSVAGGMVLSVLLKDAFQRPRPEIVPHVAYAANTSFPSGHSMMSALTYLNFGGAVGAFAGTETAEGLFLSAGGFDYFDGWREPCLPGGTLAFGRAGGLDGGRDLGDAVLARGAVAAGAEDARAGSAACLAVAGVQGRHLGQYRKPFPGH